MKAELMTFPAITSFYAALLAITFVLISGWVVAGRVQTDTLHGDGGRDDLARRIRSQGNFAEYVPYALLMIALLEASGASRILVQALCLVLLVARLLHPIGMLAPKNSPRQFACRGGGIISTFAVLLVASVALMIRVI